MKNRFLRMKQKIDFTPLVSIEEVERQRVLKHEARKMGLSIVCIDTFANYLKDKKRKFYIEFAGGIIAGCIIFLLGIVLGQITMLV